MTAVYSVTGPLFERHIATLPAAPGVDPQRLLEDYFPPIAAHRGGQYAAFVLDQATPRDTNFCDYQVTVEEIERRTSPHLTPWPALPAAAAATLKNAAGQVGAGNGLQVGNGGESCRPCRD